MEYTMSSYSFSHQFYQRWTCAPEPIRAAITQELKDITTLLQTDTPFESFEFSTHDLDAHLDNLYKNHEAEQAIAQAIADKQAKARATAEQEHIAEQKIKAAEEAKLKEETLQKEQQKNERIIAYKNNLTKKLTATNTHDKDSVDKSNTTNSDSSVTKNQKTQHSDVTEINANDHHSNGKTISEHANAVSDSDVNNKNIKDENSITAVNDKANVAIKLALKDTKLSATHQELIRELETQIDDYLSDQMMLMSENLKSWLRAEVSKSLSEPAKSENNAEPQKS